MNVGPKMGCNLKMLHLAVCLQVQGGDERRHQSGPLGTNMNISTNINNSIGAARRLRR